MKFSARFVLAIILIGCSTGALPASAQTFIRTIGSLGTGNGQLIEPYGVAVDAANGSNVIVADTLNNRIEVFTATGTFIRTIGSLGTGNGQLAAPFGVAVDTANGSNVIVADTDNGRIDVFSATGAFIRTIGGFGSGNGQLINPAGVAVDTANGSNIIVADTGNNRIEVFSATGAFIRTIGSAGTGNGQLANPVGVAVDTANGSNVIVANTGNERIEVFSATGAFIRTISGFGAGNGKLNAPFGVAVDTANGSNVIVADSGNNRVELFSATGTYIGIIGSGIGSGNGQLYNPYGVAVDTANGGNVLVADEGNNRVEVFGDTLGTSPLAASILPGGRSVQAGSSATVFATLLNTSNSSLDGCQVDLLGATGVTLDYQTTDPATNALIGSPNTPVTIAGNDQYQTFVLSFHASNAQILKAYPLVFDCDGVAPAPVTTGVNTIDLTFSATPTADIIALGATVGNTGILSVPQNGAAAFAVATENAGAASNGLTASVDTGGATLPLALTLCETNPANGQCLATPAASLPVTIAAGATPTFSIFASASGQIPFAPGTSRVFVRFLDGSGNSHGSTSVAVQTQ